MPHHLVVDLGREVTLQGITCLPRQDMANARIARAEIFCSRDRGSWGEPAARVQWPNSGELQTAKFSQAVRARYLKLVIQAEAAGNPFVAVAELDVILAK
jgi:hypothetical protein